MYKNVIKPIGDFFISFILLIFFSPIILITAILLLFENSGGIFFFQVRPGLNGRPFKIIKFKTMKDLFDEKGTPLSDNIRITRIGRLIRSASFDEILQLINIIKGDMSLVGPRPLLMQYLTRYSKEQSQRHNVKPGITGWAQVNGRNAISWEMKFVFDIEYVNKQNFLLDIKIIWLTFVNVIQRKGINANQNHTMEEFNPKNVIN